MINYCSVVYCFISLSISTLVSLCAQVLWMLAAAATEIEMVMGDDDDEIIFASFSLKKLC